MKKIFITFLLIFIINICNAQEFTISGTILDNNNKGIFGAYINIKNTYQAVLSDADGKFIISAKQNDTLVITHVSFETKEILINNQTTINVVLEEKTSEIDQVEIVGKKSGIELHSDKLIIHINQFKTEGQDFSQILSQMPTLKVSDNNINIFGKESALVYINNHQVRLSGNDLINYLNSIPPEDISQVEIMSTPPSEYSAEKNVGIIKINTSKKIAPGWKANFANYTIKGEYWSNVSSGFVNYHGKKFDFETSIIGGQYNTLNKCQYTNYYANETVETYNPRKYTTDYNNATFDFSYNFNSKNQITANFQFGIKNKDKNTDIKNITNYYNKENNLDSIMLTSGITTQKKNSIIGDITYSHKFNNDNTLFISGGYINNENNNERIWNSITLDDFDKNILQDFVYLDENFPLYSKRGNENKFRYKIITSQIDFNYKWLGLDLCTGYKLAYSTKDDILTNNYYYKETNNALYFSLEKQLSKLSFKLGVRAENCETEIDSKSDIQNFDFFPTAYLGYNINQNNRVQINYSRRIERPEFELLDPFRWYITNYNYSEGNPYLKPDYINNLELTYLFSNKLSINTYYKTIDNKFGRYVILDPINIQNEIEKADNYLDEKSLGLNIYYNLNTRKINSIISADVNYSDFKFKTDIFENRNGWYYSLSNQNNITLSPKFILAINFDNYFPGLDNYRERENIFNASMALTFLYTKNLTFRISCNDIFKTSKQKYHYNSNGIKMVYDNYYDDQYVQLTIKWKLGNWFNKDANKVINSNSEEKARL
ncbi:MAG: TonB-dependent receptor family protein [Bacteroidales bacterium]|nr:TonB-dependent receptor family protein [Bacteroidales bacterium]